MNSQGMYFYMGGPGGPGGLGGFGGFWEIREVSVGFGRSLRFQWVLGGPVGFGRAGMLWRTEIVTQKFRCELPKYEL